MLLADEEQDHWVANHTRDELMAARGRAEDGPPSDEWRPKMFVDNEGIPHGFCISKCPATHPSDRSDMSDAGIEHSKLVADKVKVWIEEVVESDRQSASYDK